MHPIDSSTDGGSGGDSSSGGISDSNSAKIMMGVFISVGLVVLITVIVIIYLKRRHANKVMEDMLPQISEDAVGKSGKKDT